ncbi:MAG: sigma-70 family RNA polymerase sigma factor [Bacteroidota bacterium]
MADHHLTELWNQFVATEDSLVFDQLYEASNKIIYLNTYRYFQNDSERRDMVQEIFIQLIENRERYTDVKHFESWIATITRNKCYNRCEKAKKQRAKMMALIASIESSDMIDNELEGSMNKEQIEQIIHGMKSKYFSKILEEHIEGYSNSEIGARIGKDSEYVRNRIYLARKELEKELKLRGLM